MSNSGRKIGTPGWRAFALLGGVLVVAFGAFASATPQEKSAATLAPAAEKTKVSSLADHPAAVAGQFQSAKSKQDSAATALTEVQTDQSPTISPSRSSGVLAPAEDRRTAQGDDGTITCSVNKEITPLNSVSCNAGGVSAANQYARCFDGATFFPAATTVISMDFGVEVAGGLGINPNVMTATLYSIAACGPVLLDASLTPLGPSAVIDIGNDNSADGTIQTVVFAPPIDIPAGTTVVAEIANGLDTNIFIGSNPNGQTCLTYLAADACGITDLTDTVVLGFADMHMVLNLQVQLGDCGNDDCEEGEDQCNCPEDCGAGGCGDDICCAAAGEDCEGCEEDCGACPFCGDGEVNGDEDCELGFLCPGGDLCLPDCTCPSAANDDCEDRVEIFDGLTPFDTTGATTDGLPTNGLGDCDAFDPFDPQIYNDIWYNYTATCSGVLTVSTCDTINYDSKIAIYDDCDTGLCPRGGDEIGCNDDGAGCGGFTSIATADVLAGNCYKIRIGGFGAEDSGNGNVDISCQVETCGNDKCQPAEGEDECSCPQDCPGECPCFIFTDQAEFEAFNEEEGKSLKGVTDFEEMPDGTGVAGFDDPLCGGIPSIPPVFPNGINQLNLCVQANILGGAPVDPDPHSAAFPGQSGLVAVELGSGFGETSDLVLANYFIDSYDIMLTSPPAEEEDDHTGVGFNTISLLGGASVEIRVYNKANVEVLSVTSAVDVAGSNFWGVWCSDPIGRINIFDPASGAEGGDNIQLWHDVTCEPACEAPAVCLGGSCCGDGIVDPNEECDAAGCGDCPTDADGNGETKAPDLAFLLGNWGDLPPDAAPNLVCLDSDDSGDIKAPDLAVLLGNWGDCPVNFGGPCDDADCQDDCTCIGRGACCEILKGEDPHTCEAALTADECAAAGGQYAGDDTDCDDCPDPICFDAEGSCFETQPTPGCANSECCGIVCNSLPDGPFCCKGFWDEICVGLAEDLCPPPSCGDGSCDPGEDCCGCEIDCGPCECGDGTCNAPCESNANCPADCELSSCGNCDAGGTCDLQVGLNGLPNMVCNDGQWFSLAYPFDGNIGMVDTITMVNNTNTGGGDLYLMASAADCGGPDVNNILATVCDGITGLPTGVPNDICIGPVDTTGFDKIWVVAVFRSTFSFDIAYNSATCGTPDSGFANLGGLPGPGEWQDLNNFDDGAGCTFGACYCVDISDSGSCP